MGLRPGDKVSLLNEKFDGKVVKIIDEHQVEVEDEHGFAFPVLVKEVVKIQTGIEEEAKDNAPKFDFRPKEIHKLGNGLFLLVSDHGKHIEAYFLNNLKNKALVQIRQKVKGEWLLKNTQEVGSGRYIGVGQWQQEDLNEFKEFSCCFLTQEWTVKQLPQPEYYFLKVQPKVFVTKEGQKEIEQLEHKGWVFPMTKAEKTFEDPEKYKVLVKESMADQPIDAIRKMKGPKVVGNISLKHAHRRPELEEEIDLHIEKITDDYSNLGNAEIVQLQLNAAREKLDKCLLGGTHRLVLIHGIGNGRLKTEIRKLLDGYFDIRYEDASFKKYGAGATMVHLK